MRNKITFSDLVGRIAHETGTSRQLIHNLLKELVTVVNEGLLSDGKVSITGLGIFGLKWRAARQGINPQTGDVIEIPAHNQVYFNAEAALRRFINRKYEHIKSEIIVDDIKQSSPIYKPKDSFSWIKGRTLIWSAVLLGLLLIVMVKVFSIEKLQRYPVPQLEAKITVSRDDVAKTEKKPRRYPVPQPEVFVESTPQVSETAKQKPVDPARLPDEVQTSTAQTEVADKTEAEATPMESMSDKTLSVGKEKRRPSPELENNVAETRTEDTETERIKKRSPVPKPDFLVASEGNSGSVHHIRRGDRLWVIAKFFYTDPFLWPNIYRVNSEVIENPDMLEVGKSIYVPPLEGRVGNLSQNDMMDIIEGYVRVYLAYRRLGNINAPYFLWVATKQNIPEVLGRYKDSIVELDRRFIQNIRGSVQIR